MNRTIEQAKNCICPVKIKDVKWCQGDECMAWDQCGTVCEECGGQSIHNGCKKDCKGKLVPVGYCKIIEAMSKK